MTTLTCRACALKHGGKDRAGHPKQFEFGTCPVCKSLGLLAAPEEYGATFPPAA
jgi:hypothetical protein